MDGRRIKQQKKAPCNQLLVGLFNSSSNFSSTIKIIHINSGTWFNCLTGSSRNKPVFSCVHHVSKDSDSLFIVLVLRNKSEIACNKIRCSHVMLIFFNDRRILLQNHHHIKCHHIFTKPKYVNKGKVLVQHTERWATIHNNQSENWTKQKREDLNSFFKIQIKYENTWQQTARNFIKITVCISN